jgi:rare lipoprotein A
MTKQNFKIIFFIVLMVVSVVTTNQLLGQMKTKTDSVKKTTENKIETTTTIEEIDSIIPKKVKSKLFKENGIASYYADKFHNRKTASGAMFDNNKLTAAHKKLPFGTKLRVTNLANKKSVIVVVNDRGPFIKGREIDLSKKAYMSIATNLNSGVIKVNLEIIER